MSNNTPDEHFEEKNLKREPIIDKAVLGTLDTSKIPSGYGVVQLDKQRGEVLITNDVGDVILFIDPNTRSLSTMELKEVEWDAGAFLSGLDDLPEEYKEAMEQAKMPKSFHVTKSPEGTEFVHGIGEGTPENPLEIVQRSTHVYKDISLAHIAIAKHVAITKQPLTITLNQVLFTYFPGENGSVSIEATVTFRPPRDFDSIDEDMKADRNISYIDWDYHNFLIENPDIFKDPIEWYREDYYGYGMNMAKSMFSRVQERLYNQDL